MYRRDNKRMGLLVKYFPYRDKYLISLPMRGITRYVSSCKSYAPHVPVFYLALTLVYYARGLVIRCQQTTSRNCCRELSQRLPSPMVKPFMVLVSYRQKDSHSIPGECRSPPVWVEQCLHIQWIYGGGGG